MEKNDYIRKAEKKDASRLAEILIFTKRNTYRPFFQNDAVSFNEMQVLDLALQLRDQEEERKDIYVYDDGIVRGMARWREADWEDGTECIQLDELYVDAFFHGLGIGTAFMKKGIEEAQTREIKRIYLWVLEKNQKARRFYEGFGFRPDGSRRLEPDTPEYLLRYVLEM